MADERNVEEVEQETTTEEAAAQAEADTQPEETAEGVNEEAEEGSEAEEDGNKKGFFSKKKDKKEEAYKAQIAELQDKVMRQMAEFENYRRRTDKEKTAMFETGAKSVIEKVLPVVDNFERGLAMIPEDKMEDPIADGMNKIYKQLITELENLGVKPIEAVGVEFNPDLHNAVMQVANDELESGTVAQELLKGYTYRESVVRHSMVAVVE